MSTRRQAPPVPRVADGCAALENVAPLIGITSQQLHRAGAWPLPYYGQAAPYVEAVMAAGGAPVLLTMGDDPEILRRQYDAIGGLLLSGGEDIASALYGARPHPASEPP